MSQKWFEEYVYDVVVDKKYLSDDLVKLWEEPAIDLKPWEHIGL